MKGEKHSASAATDTIVQVWKDSATLHKVAADGYEALLSAGWYVGSKSKWQAFYAVEPFEPSGSAAFPWTPAEKARVLGGGVSKWGCSGFCPFPDKQ